MKKIEIILILLILNITSNVSYSQTLSTLDYLTRMSKTNLPFFETTITSSKNTYESYAFNVNTNNIIQYKLYKNLNTTNYTTDTTENSAIMNRLFNQPNSAFNLIATRTGESDLESRYLVTMDTTGVIIDYIESGVIFYSLTKIAIKQFSISSDMQVTVYWLNVTSPTNVDPFNFTSVTAQRTDKVYQIDTTGHFTQIQQRLYQPKTYTKAWLEDMSKNIWDGGEILIP
ncbi:MAG: hypothetical protein PHS30_02765 [Bacteroidales bacterium]|nr:hypothetical protein [Bacteroidales bacterium]